MSPRALWLRILLLLLLFAISAHGRRGGSDGDGDSEDDGSDSSRDDRGTSTSSNEHCGPRFQSFEGLDIVPDNVQNWTSSDAGGRRGSNPTTYDGAYFYGEAC